MVQKMFTLKHKFKSQLNGQKLDQQLPIGNSFPIALFIQPSLGPHHVFQVLLVLKFSLKKKKKKAYLSDPIFLLVSAGAGESGKSTIVKQMK